MLHRRLGSAGFHQLSISTQSESLQQKQSPAQAIEGILQKHKKTYNSGYSPVVTHLTTNPPVHCLSTAERTGSSIFSVLWSYVEEQDMMYYYNVNKTGGVRQWMNRKGT
jgi:hypothetical protein